MRANRLTKTFRLTPALVAAHAGSNVVCLAGSAMGQTFRLYASRPGPSLNRRLSATIVDADGEVSDPEDDGPALVTRVDLSGVLEARAGYQSECGGWTDGHDALSERMIAALAESDVMLVIDSPGGAHAGLEQAVGRVMRAKETFGRRITGYVDETCGSAAFWWAACVCDEIYAPPSGLVGSIGARAAHASEAGALAKEGLEINFFVWPGPGKVAFAPELPLSEIGRARGERDTAIAGEAFAAAVGPRRGMSRDEIVALDADVLCGAAAYDAKLIDGVCTLEECLSYCIARAETSAQISDGDTMATKANENKNVLVGSAALAVADGGVSPAVRAEGDDEPDSDGDGDGDRAAGMEPDAICRNCGMQNVDNAKYCNQCGDSMEARPLESEEDAPEKDDEGDEPKKSTPPPGPGAKAEDPKPAEPEAKRAAAPPAMREASASYANLLGLRRGASDVAIKTALVRKLQVVDYVARLTNTNDHETMLGQLRALSEDAAASGKLRADISTLRKQSDAKERLDLLLSLARAGLPDYPRGNLLIDEVAANGRVIAIKPAPAYAEMKIGTLRGLVKGKLANAAPAAVRSPYEPDPAKAQAASAAGANAAQIEAAKRNPAVIKMTQGPNAIPLETAASIYAREFGGK